MTCVTCRLTAKNRDQLRQSSMGYLDFFMFSSFGQGHEAMASVLDGSMRSRSLLSIWPIIRRSQLNSFIRKLASPNFWSYKVTKVLVLVGPVRLPFQRIWLKLTRSSTSRANTTVICDKCHLSSVICAASVMRGDEKNDNRPIIIILHYANGQQDSNIQYKHQQ